jgi:HCOMODA/2-hydroxy-3-carboxy-muconic semialdehyde decarboxylase
VSGSEPDAGAPASEAARAAVSRTAQVVAAHGLVHAFGHVSVRDGDRIWITPTFPPMSLGDADTILDATDVGGLNRPLETPLHLAIYAARRDVGAICRIHGSALASWAARRTAPPVLHGFGGLCHPVAVWTDPDLIANDDVAESVAACLGSDGRSLVLAGNGGLAVGTTLEEAAARAWCLEDRCRVALDVGGDSVELTDDELTRRARWFDAEASRLWRWMDAIVDRRY